MGTPFFHEFKKQASFFFKEKIKTARLALTDVTPAQILTEEATNGNPDTQTLKIISRSAFEVDDYWRIVEILHTRLSSFDRKNWRQSYNAAILLDHLLTHGPESFAEEFQSDKNVIIEMGNFQHIDEKGFNWGLNVANKSEKILKMLDDKTFLKKERDRARNLSRGIQGFGSFSHRSSSSTQKILKESPIAKYKRSNSEFNHQEDNENQLPSKEQGENPFLIKKMDKFVLGNSHSHNQRSQTNESRLKENVNLDKESKPLLNDEMDEGIFEDHHPFNEVEHLSDLSLLSGASKMLQAC